MILTLSLFGCGRDSSWSPPESLLTTESKNLRRRGDVRQLFDPSHVVEPIGDSQGLQGIIVIPQRPEGLMIFLHGTTGDLYGGLRAGWGEFFISRNWAVAFCRSSGMSDLIQSGTYSAKSFDLNSPKARREDHLRSSWQADDHPKLVSTITWLQSRTGISAEQTALVGFSNGGALAGMIGWTHPGMVADIVLLSSVRFPYAVDPSQMSAVPKGDLSHLRWHFFHGRRDSSAPFKGMKQNIKALKSQGVTRLTKTVDAKRGHSFWVDHANELFKALTRP